jgi:hypothetical protein
MAESTRHKLAELAALEGVTQAQVLNNLVQAEHRYRRNDIDRMRASKHPDGKPVEYAEGYE